jgi:glutamate-ammonia-ligase adenylyltransferase
MPNTQIWNRALKLSAVPDRARHYLEQLRETVAKPGLESATAEQARLLLALLSGSRALSESLLAHPEWTPACLDEEAIRHPRRTQGLQREVQQWLDPLLRQDDHATALTRLREFRQREMLRIATRDLAGMGSVAEVIREISDVADLCISSVYRLLRKQFARRFGEPFHLDVEGCWQPTEFCVFGMGKLGGQELNYSSDVDLIFVYSEEGHVFREPPKPGSRARGLSNHQFFQRLIENLVEELTHLTAEGFLYRVDLRLRPEGDTGPLARSLAGYENYYSQWGQTWERMMLIKARCVAGDASLAAEFLEMVQPFRYARSLPGHVLNEIAAMKQRIETEVVRSGELDRNVKLGRGGIREIEFVVQTLQLLQGGRLPFLQSSQTLPALAKMAQYGVLEESTTRDLSEAYGFLRKVEHRLQMEDNRQTHTIPDDAESRLRLAVLMGFESAQAFDTGLRQQTESVRQHYDAVLRVESDEPPLPLPGEFATDESAWKSLLARHTFTQVERSCAILRTLVEGPGYIHVSPRTVDLARRVTYQLLQMCPRHDEHGASHWPKVPLSDPDRVLARLDSYLAAYGSRSMLYEAWTRNPSVFGLLVLLFDRSEFLAETAIRTPDLVEDLMLSGQLRRRKTSEQILDELRHGAEDEDQMAWIRRYHEAEFMRLGLRDILGLVDFELNLTELSGLADACLQYSLEAVMRRHRLKAPPFAIIGLGKLGGSELTYGSDLDITFVASSRVRSLHKLQRIAAQVMELLSSPTSYGVAFATDARLRPDGEKGLMVNTLKAYEDYYRQRGMLWEIQAISRARVVAGDLQTGERFNRLVSRLADFSRPRPRLACYRKEWMREIHRMRVRIEKERTPSGQDALAIKTGRGGLIDVEFIAQALCLAHGRREPNSLRALEMIQENDLLPAAIAGDLMQHYRSLLRIEGILRRWSFVGEAVLPQDHAALYRVAVRCGFRTADAFLADVADHRAAIRRAFAQVFSDV